MNLFSQSMQGNIERRIFELKKVAQVLNTKKHYLINLKFSCKKLLLDILILSTLRFVFRGPNGSIAYFLSTVQAFVRKLYL